MVRSKEQKKAYNQAYYQAHREEMKVYQQVYREAHKEEAKASSRAYYLDHQEEMKARNRAYRLAHLEQLKVQQRVYHLANLERLNAYSRAYQHSHPEKYIASEQKRRALELGVAHQPYNAEEIYQRDRGICGLCHKKVAKADRSIDHILPISLGGADAPHNVQLAHLRCNLSKHNSARFPANLKLALG
jgi:5-methylcytosine-specific restriction endonuclease McrA